MRAKAEQHQEVQNNAMLLLLLLLHTEVQGTYWHTEAQYTLAGRWRRLGTRQALTGSVCPAGHLAASPIPHCLVEENQDLVVHQHTHTHPSPLLCLMEHSLPLYKWTSD